MCGQVESVARACHTNSLSFSRNREKARRTKKKGGESESERQGVSESEARGGGRREGESRETFIVEWPSTDNPWHRAF